MRRLRLGGRAAVAASAVLLLATFVGCSGGDDPNPRGAAPGEGASATASDPTSDPGAGSGADLEAALSAPREDSVYPDIGDPGVDAFHYDLTLDWDPDSDTLTGTEVLTFRSTTTAPRFQLDMAWPLEVGSLTLDGEPVTFAKRDKDLVVEAPVTEDQRYELALSYSGTPEAVPAPTRRGDFSTTGFTITDAHETWTMQEPYGAFTWYAVNDQPSDKAFYDFTLSVPSPWVGVANGTLESRSEADGVTTTDFHLGDPAASYLTTLAFGDFEATEDVSESGVPLTYWVNRKADPQVLRDLQTAPAAMAWLEDKLGPYPFDTFGMIVVDSDSGMETQTMVTLGDTDYTTSAAVILHEMGHQWYGDTVTPDDWRDVWMNEGMTMYLQGMWQADQDGRPVGDLMDEWAEFEDEERAAAGPPADYDPTAFGSGNIYYGPALMWHELRERIGEEKFFELLRDWPAANANGSAGREGYLAWVEEQTGLELSSFFDDWLLGRTTPPRG